jgi:putative ABC transport system permease protein
MPANAGKNFRLHQQALVDQTLLLQFNIKPGDSIKVGNLSFEIAGSLLSAPGQTGISASIAPLVYIPIQYLSQTGLEQKGSRINYRFFFKYDRKVDLDEIVKKLSRNWKRWELTTIRSALKKKIPLNRSMMLHGSCRSLVSLHCC